MVYRYRLKTDVGVSHLFLEKDSLTLTREWYPTLKPLLETQLKNLIEAQWSETSNFIMTHDLWTDPPQEKIKTNVIIEVSTSSPLVDRNQAIKDAMKRLFNKPVEMVHLSDIEEELP